MNKINKLSPSATILVGCVILGGFYYATQITKQNSIERQQQIELDTKRQKEASEKLDKMFCVSEAEERATEQYKEICTYDCKEGYYYTANYENYYKGCLRRKGLE
jgi:threonyl-tRNA synthetase